MITKVILDFETSGLNPYHDDIIEIAMKVMDSDNQFTTLVKPKSNECISDEISSLTGITNKMLMKEGQFWGDAYQSMNEWLNSVKGENDKIVIISHNGESFDFIFLRRVFNELNKILGVQNTIPIDKIIFIDTLLLAKRLLPRRYAYKQFSLCKSFHINTEGCHRAMNDVIALEKLYFNLENQLDKELEKRRKVSQNPEMVYDYIKIK